MPSALLSGVWLIWCGLSDLRLDVPLPRTAQRRRRNKAWTAIPMTVPLTNKETTTSPIGPPQWKDEFTRAVSVVQDA